MLVVTLLVRDEADVIAANIEHHLDQGAELVIVTDNGSVDGTVEIIDGYVRQGVARLIHEPTHDYAQSVWVTRMARMAATEYGADWVVNADADEFWQPTDPSLTLAIALAQVPLSFGSVLARRVNFVGLLDESLPWVQRLVFRDVLSLSERGTPLGPKTCHRASAEVIVAMGNHAVDGPGTCSTLDMGLLEILHFPMRSFDQYERKIANGGSSLDRNPDLPKEVGWHWRADFQRLQDGTLRLAYESRLPTAEAIADSSDRFIRDESFCQHLERLTERAIEPSLLRRSLGS